MTTVLVKGQLQRSIFCRTLLNISLQMLSLHSVTRQKDWPVILIILGRVFWTKQNDRISLFTFQNQCFYVSSALHIGNSVCFGNTCPHLPPKKKAWGGLCSVLSHSDQAKGHICLCYTTGSICIVYVRTLSDWLDLLISSPIGMVAEIGGQCLYRGPVSLSRRLWPQAGISVSPRGLSWSDCLARREFFWALVMGRSSDGVVRMDSLCRSVPGVTLTM